MMHFPDLKARTRYVAAAVCAAVILGGFLAQPAQAQLKLTFVMTDQDVDTAMERLQNYLWLRQLDDGGWKDVVGSHYDRKIGGTTALATLALLESDVRVGEPKMEKALQALLATEMDDLYCRTVRVMALCQAYRQAQREEFETQIVEDLFWLTDGLPQAGAWGYKGPERAGDNSCSQYGLLAVWEAMWAGFDRNKKLQSTDREIQAKWNAVRRNIQRSWRAIEKQWADRQRPDNGWTYPAMPGEGVTSTMTMTAAGVASLYIIIDEVYAPRMQPGKPRPRTTAFERVDTGMDWLAERIDKDFTKDGYLAFGVQRIAMASGHKYIGEEDWFRLGVEEIADRASDARRELGGPYGTDVQAAFYLLFLARGRVPVTFNKLERPGTDWDVAPRDIANLTRYLVMSLEQRMTWQIVNVNRPVGEWLDAPILFINGIKKLENDPEMVRKLREYILYGGFVVGEATTGSRGFAQSFTEALEKAFPEGQEADAQYYRWQELPPEHPIFSSMSERDRKRLGPVKGMSTPNRTIAVLLESDQATAWQNLDIVKHNESFMLGRNLFVYGTAAEPLRTRLRPVFAGVEHSAEETLKLAVLQPKQQWLGAPYAVQRLSDKLAVDALFNVEHVDGAAPATLEPSTTPMIWIIGKGVWKPDDQLVEKLRTYIASGGMVAINASLGDDEFARSAQSVAKRLLPDVQGQAIGDSDPIMTGLVYRERGKPIDDPGFRRPLFMSGVRAVELTGYRTDDRWGVIVSPHDIFVSMLGTPIYGNEGYDGPTAQQLATNMYLYALEKAQ